MRRPRREIEELRDFPSQSEAESIENASATHLRQRRFVLDARIVVVLLVAAIGATWLVSHRSRSTAVASVKQDVRVGVTAGGPVALRLDRVVQDGSHLTADFFVREPADARLVTSLVILPETAESGPNAEPIRITPDDAAAQTFSISTFDLPRRDRRITKLSVTAIEFALPGDASWTVDLSRVWPPVDPVRSAPIDRELQAGGVTFTLTGVVATRDRLEFDVQQPAQPSIVFEPTLTIGVDRYRESADTTSLSGMHAVFFEGIPARARTATLTLESLTQSLTGPWSWRLKP